LSVLSGKAVAI